MAFPVPLSPLSGSSASPWIFSGATFPADDALEGSLHRAAYDYLCRLSCYDCDLSSVVAESGSDCDGPETGTDEVWIGESHFNGQACGFGRLAFSTCFRSR